MKTFESRLCICLEKRDFNFEESVLSVRNFFIFVIELYRKFVSPYLGTHCRFEPTCSRYSMEAFKKYGSIKGLYLTIRRILKCHPFHPGGYDPLE